MKELNLWHLITEYPILSFIIGLITVVVFIVIVLFIVLNILVGYRAKREAEENLYDSEIDFDV